jgi:hypothetical protein
MWFWSSALLAWFSRPPPPYTPNPFVAQSSTPEVRKLLIHRFLFESIAFAYDVDYSQLKAALSPTAILQPSGPSTVDENFLLSCDKRYQILHLADLVDDLTGKLLFEKHRNSKGVRLTEHEAGLL